MKKYIKIIFMVAIIVGIVGFATVHYSVDTDKKDGINSFPDSYKPYLQELQKQHPNWKFTALYIDLDWKYVIDNENIFGKNLVPKSYSDRWKNTKPGQYNVEVDAGWVDSSRRAVEYTMDPRNFLNEVRIFQFEGLSYDANTNNLEGIEKILYGTEFYNKIVQYKTSSGSTVTMSSKYSDLILSAGKKSKVSSYHLASRIKQEVGPFLSHDSISGTVKGYEGLYNFYNIGATSSSAPMGAIKNGLQYAKDGKGASQTVKDKYLIPWNNKDKAITGGGIFIGSSYIHLGQDTIYLQKFHVVGTGELFWHQYMTNVLAPYSESNIIYNGYVKSNMLNNSMSFIIPVYKNMPTTPVENPNILEKDFVKDNTKVYANVQSTLNIRTGPSTSYETLTSVNKNTVMTRIAKGRQSGELWDKVQLSNGMIGYAFHNYIKEVPVKEIEKINLSVSNSIMKKGESQKLVVEILPEEAKNHEVIYSSSNPKVASIDNKGNILATQSGETTIKVKAKENNVSAQIKIQVYSSVTDILLNIEELVIQVEDKFVLKLVILPLDASNKNVLYQAENESIVQVDSKGEISAISEGESKIIVKSEEGNITKEIKVIVVPRLQEGDIKFDESLTVSQNEISGWVLNQTDAEHIKDKIDSIYHIEIYDYQGNLLPEDKKAGTGSRIRLVDDNGTIKMEYYIIIYGDVNGDGQINTIDLLVLQRHILEIEPLRGVFIKAGNINKNGNNPSSLDSLLIQRHILELKLIEQ